MHRLLLAKGSVYNPCKRCSNLHGTNRKLDNGHIAVCYAKNQRDFERQKDKVSAPNSDKVANRVQKPYVISDWRASEFWSTITWNAALPATFAVAIQYIQTNSFIKVTLPAAEFAQDMLLWTIPTITFDFLVHGPLQNLMRGYATSQSPKLLQELHSGMKSYVAHVKKISKQEHRHMPPVQRASARLIVCTAQQFALQGVITSALLAFLFEITTQHPTALPVLLNVPGTSTVDGAFVGTVALLSIPLAMMVARIKQSKSAFRDDYLERRTAQFIVDPRSAGIPATSSVVNILSFVVNQVSPSHERDTVGPRDRRLSKSAVNAYLSGCRLSLLTTSSCMIYMQTGSVLATAWVMFICANFQDRICRL